MKWVVACPGDGTPHAVPALAGAPVHRGGLAGWVPPAETDAVALFGTDHGQRTITEAEIREETTRAARR